MLDAALLSPGDQTDKFTTYIGDGVQFSGGRIKLVDARTAYSQYTVM